MCMCQSFVHAMERPQVNKWNANYSVMCSYIINCLVNGVYGFREILPRTCALTLHIKH